MHAPAKKLKESKTSQKISNNYYSKDMYRHFHIFMQVYKKIY